MERYDYKSVWGEVIDEYFRREEVDRGSCGLFCFGLLESI